MAWSAHERDGRKLFVGALQLFSDRKTNTLRRQVIKLLRATRYTLHETLLDLPENVRSRKMVSVFSVGANLTVIYQSTVGKKEKRCGHGTKRSRIAVVAALNDSTKRALQLLYEAVNGDVPCETADDVALKYNMVLCSYVANIPETGDLSL